MIAPDVVITGLGVLSCNGTGREDYWDALKAGKSGIDTVKSFDVSSFPCQIAGELIDFDPLDYMRKSTVKHWHRHVHQGLAVAKMAVEDADFASASYASERVAVAIGTSVGSPNEAYQSQLEAFQSDGYKKISKFGSSAFSGHSATVHVTIDLGFRGPAITIASGCATGLDVLAWGYNQIRLGLADAALIGATESPLFPMSFASACSLGILSKNNKEPEKAMRPFDKFRDGIVLSEGACAVMLERADYAKARGARVLGEILGNASASEGRSPLILDKSGVALAQACTTAMNNAGLQPHELDHIQAHGVSLEMYDHCETNAYKLALGEHAHRIPISAIKSMVGQPYAAGGLLGVGAGLLALEEGIIAPTINLDEPDPDCDLDYVANTARRNDVDTVLVSSISFGGTHSATVLRKVA